MKKDTKQEAQFILDGLKEQVEMVQKLIDQEETPVITAFTIVCNEDTGQTKRMVSGNGFNLATTLMAGCRTKEMRRVLRLIQTMLETED